MLSPPVSTRDIVKALRRPDGAYNTPDNKTLLLRSPVLYKAGLQDLEDSYLEKLIEKNILEKNGGTRHEIIKSRLIASEVRGLFNSLSEENQKKFSRLVRAFDIAINYDKNSNINRKILENIKIKIAAGEIRVVAATGITMVLNVLFDLLGIKVKNFYGISAGSFPAAGLAFKAPNSIVFANTVDTKYDEITKKRKHLQEWVNDFMKEAYCFSTGKKENEIGDGVMRKRHLDEIGNNYQAFVGEVTKYFPIFSSEKSLSPEAQESIYKLKSRFLNFDGYWLPESLETRYGVKSDDFPLAKASVCSANLPTLFFNPWDPTFGRCFIKDKNNKNHYLIDPGVVKEYSLPVRDLEESINDFVNKERELPPFDIHVGNRGVDHKNLSYFDRKLNNFIDWIDSYSIDYSEKIKNLGAERTYVESFSEANDPFINGNTCMLKTRTLGISCHDKEVLICANIPTNNFKDLKSKPAIIQLYEKFVDDKYVNSNGAVGKSPFDLYVEEILTVNNKEPDILKFKNKEVKTTWAFKFTKAASFLP